MKNWTLLRYAIEINQQQQQQQQSQQFVSCEW